MYLTQYKEECFLSRNLAEVNFDFEKASEGLEIGH